MRVKGVIFDRRGNIWNAPLAIKLAIARYEQTICFVISSEMLESGAFHDWYPG